MTMGEAARRLVISMMTQIGKGEMLSKIRATSVRVFTTVTDITKSACTMML